VKSNIILTKYCWMELRDFWEGYFT
jgi:hypothetical protein